MVRDPSKLTEVNQNLFVEEGDIIMDPAGVALNRRRERRGD